MRTMLAFLATTTLLAVLLASQLDPTSPLFWEASLSPAIMAIRGVLTLALVWFLIYVPESPWIRIAVGLSASSLLVGIIGGAATGILKPIDLITLFPAIIAVFVELLESKPVDEPFAPLERAGEMRDWWIGETKTLAARIAQLSWLLAADIRLTLDSHRTPDLGARALSVDKQMASGHTAYIRL